MPSLLFVVSVLVAVVSSGLYYALHVLPQPVFPVHKDGVVLITGCSSGIGRRDCGV